MKSTLLFTVLLAFTFSLSAANITIIESSQGASWAVQDTVWRFIATGMGHNATIVAQNTLASITNLASTDVLILSSATKGFTSPDYLQTLKQFVLTGRPVYIQSEYLLAAQGNKAFDTLMHAVGSDFQWLNSISGQLTPMNVTGGFSSTPNAVSPLSYFNAGLSGDGTGIEKFLELNGNFYGFCYIDPNGVNGTIMTTSDQDWIWHNESPALIANMLFRLVQSITTSTAAPVDREPSIKIFPNPVVKSLFIKSDLSEPSCFEIFDALGKCFISGVLQYGYSEIPVHILSSGFYSLWVDGRGRKQFYKE